MERDGFEQCPDCGKKTVRQATEKEELEYYRNRAEFAAEINTFSKEIDELIENIKKYILYFAVVRTIIEHNNINPGLISNELVDKLFKLSISDTDVP